MKRTVLLVQLPIPPLGPDPIRGNVPLAAAYLKLFVERQGLDNDYHIEVLPSRHANTLGDRALVAAILSRDPWLIGFTCYLWNIERTLWIARELKQRRPEVRIVLGGPEITADNAWVLESPDYDLAVIGEGEQTFARLLQELRVNDIPSAGIPGLYVPPTGPGSRYDPSRIPAFRTPIADLNELGSPYLAGILDAGEENMLLLETSRGCRFKCKFCYYWKSYNDTYYLPEKTIRANLQHASDRCVEEVVLLDPTLNQRKDFAGLLRLLAGCNPGRRFTYFGELRGEGITEDTARLLREANFSEVEVGLQSIDPEAMTLMDRRNNLRAFERGVRAMMAEGIKVKVDLIIGLPGDTVESIRRGLHYLHDNRLGSEVQVFNLAVLPGTAFRQEAAALGLRYQPRPPYYVLETPNLDRPALFGLMQEAQELFDVEFDAQPEPVLDFRKRDPGSLWRIDLDQQPYPAPPAAEERTQAFTLWLRSARFATHEVKVLGLVRRLLEDNPFTTLQVVMEMKEGAASDSVQPQMLARLMSECQKHPTYLDKFYALQPGRINGAKRLVVLLPPALRRISSPEWVESIEEYATLVRRNEPRTTESESEAELVAGRANGLSTQANLHAESLGSKLRA